MEKKSWKEIYEEQGKVLIVTPCEEEKEDIIYNLRKCLYRERTSLQEFFKESPLNRKLYDHAIRTDLKAQGLELKDMLEVMNIVYSSATLLRIFYVGGLVQEDERLELHWTFPKHPLVKVMLFTLLSLRRDNEPSIINVLNDMRKQREYWPHFAYEYSLLAEKEQKENREYDIDLNPLPITQPIILSQKLGWAIEEVEVEGEEAPTPKEVQPTPPYLPPELNNERAIRFLRHCQNEGWLDERFKPTEDMTFEKKALLIKYLAEMLKIKNKWKVFCQFWDIENKESVRAQINKKKENWSEPTREFDRLLKKTFAKKHKIFKI